MGGRDSPRPDDDLATMADGVAAVRAPSDPGVSSSHPSDSDLEISKIESGPDSPTLIDGLPTPPLKRVSPAGSGFSSQSSSLLPPGAVLGQRYVILQILGQGGMGAVYKARDREVDRVVALKVIRPDLAGNAAIIDRFKQELVLSHQVTHKNVVRIYDLGEADGVKFITMEYIEGKDLRTLIQETTAFSPEEAVETMRQVCRALEAAHAVGVIHRDLKPQNIMRDNQGRVVVMDFGLARSLDSNDGMTQTGAVIGTMEYMSPEQGLGKPLDQRSDLFTVGLIFYELLTGKMPYKSDSALASLLKRTQERAAPVSQHNSKIPSALSNIVAKCLEPDLKTRYQHVVEVLSDLEAWQGKDAAVSLQFPAVKPWAQTVPWTWIGAVAAVLVLAAAGFFYTRSRSGASSAQPAPVTLLVADFDNQTSDAVFDGTLEPTFNLALESASFINSFSRGQAHTVGAQLRPGTTALDEPLARLVAVREGIGAIIAGSVSRNGNGFKITSKAIDAVTGKTIAEAESEADNKEDVLRSVGKLAAHIRSALGDTTPESVQLAKAETYSTGSLEAAHEYAVAQDLQAAGKFQDAKEHYSKTIELDPDMGRAYAGRAAVMGTLGHRNESLKDYQMAMARIDRMTDREKYRTRGGYYLLVREPKKAIEEYSALVKQFPSDDAGYSNLALSYFYLHDMTKAVEEGRHAVEIYPNEVFSRINVALYATYAGDFAAGAKEASAIVQGDPNNAYAYRALALSQFGEGKIADASNSYSKLGGLGADNASVASLGVADIALYQGRVSEAIATLDKGVAADMAQKDAASAATKLVAMAYANWLGGHDTQAVAAADRAVALDKETNVLFAAGRIYVDGGQPAKALSLASQLSNSIESDPQLYGKLLEGEARLKRGETKDAIRLFQAAQTLSDTWLGHFDLGRGYLEAGLFTEADSEFETCIKRNGEASAVFLDDLPTFRLLPPLYYYLGRAQEGLKSPAARDSYRKFVSLQEQGTGPLLADARRRLASN